MIQLGIFNKLRIKRETPQGFYLQSLEDDEEVLLPNKYITPDMEFDQVIEAFVYTDSEDRLVAVTDTPKILLHEFAFLTVNDVSPFGAFLDWGMEKDLFVPFRNQTKKMQKGESYVVYLYEDEESDRLVATAKYGQFLSNEAHDLNDGDEVVVLIEGKTDLGMKVIVNGEFRGLIYHNEIFKRIEVGMTLPAFVKKVREDGRLDISLEPQGAISIEPNAQKLLSFIKMNKGRTNLTDKSDPELIKSYLQMSKKNFKKALGSLYKQKLVTLLEDGVELTENGKKA